MFSKRALPHLRVNIVQAGASVSVRVTSSPNYNYLVGRPNGPYPGSTSSTLIDGPMAAS